MLSILQHNSPPSPVILSAVKDPIWDLQYQEDSLPAKAGTSKNCYSVFFTRSYIQTSKSLL